MLTTMTEQDWTIVLQVFQASRSRRGDKGRADRKFLEALHYFVVHNITWRALPPAFGHCNSVWKRFWRLSRTGTFEAFFDVLAAMSETAHLVQMFDSTVVRFRQSRIDPTPKTCPLSFRKFSTRAAPVSSKRSASSNDSSASHYAARRRRGIMVRLLRSRSASS